MIIEGAFRQYDEKLNNLLSSVSIGQGGLLSYFHRRKEKTDGSRNHAATKMELFVAILNG